MSKLIRKFVTHPVIVAINEDSLGRWVCRVFGHRWRWPVFMVAFDFDRRVVQVSQETYCVRCGYADGDGYPDTVVHLRNLGDRDVVGHFGEKVNRMMGWN